VCEWNVKSFHYVARRVALNPRQNQAIDKGLNIVWGNVRKQAGASFAKVVEKVANDLAVTCISAFAFSDLYALEPIAEESISTSKLHALLVNLGVEVTHRLPNLGLCSISTGRLLVLLGDRDSAALIVRPFLWGALILDARASLGSSAIP